MTNSARAAAERYEKEYYKDTTLDATLIGAFEWILNRDRARIVEALDYGGFLSPSGQFAMNIEQVKKIVKGEIE